MPPTELLYSIYYTKTAKDLHITQWASRRRHNVLLDHGLILVRGLPLQCKELSRIIYRPRCGGLNRIISHYHVERWQLFKCLRHLGHKPRFWKASLRIKRIHSWLEVNSVCPYVQMLRWVFGRAILGHYASGLELMHAFEVKHCLI